jgi:hypothetical protein
MHLLNFYTSLEYVKVVIQFTILSSSANPNGHLTRPLNIAAEKGDIRLVQELLDAGADKSFGDIHGHLAHELTTDPEIKDLIEQYEVLEIKEPDHA